MKKILFSLILGHFIIFGIKISAQSIQIRIPDTTALVGTQFDVPVYVDSDLTGKGVTSFRVQINFSSANLQVVSVQTTGTISESLGTPAINTSVPGQLSIAEAGSQPLSGSGILFFISFKVLNQCQCPVTFSNASYTYFNEGSPSLILKNANFNLSPKPYININSSAGYTSIGDSISCSAYGGIWPYHWSVTNTSVASINSDGYLKGIKSGTTKIIATDFDGTTDTSGFIIEIRGLKLSINDTSAWQGSTLEIPVLLSNFENLQIYSGSFSVSFDTSYLKLIEVKSTGTLLALASTSFNIKNAVQADFSFATENDISTSGVLFFLEFIVSSARTGGCNISFSNIALNENLTSDNKNCNFSILTLPTLYISPAINSLTVGETQQFSVSGNEIPPIHWSVNDTTIAVITQNGLITAKRSGTVKVMVSDSIGASGILNNLQIFDAHLILPDTSICPEVQDFYYPISISSLPADKSVFSIQATVNFDTTYLVFIDIDISGTLTSNWTFARSSFNGKIIFAGSGTTPFNVAGTIVKMRFGTKPGFKSGINTFINLSNILLNEGDPKVLADNQGTISSADLPYAPYITLNQNLLSSNYSTGNQWYEKTYGLIPGATNQNYLPVKDGQYYIIETSGGCASDTSNLVSYFIKSLIADYSYSLNNLTITLNDSSSGSPSSWFWTFGDGYSALGKNQSHSYSNPGKYSVCLIAENNELSDQVCKNIYVGSVFCTIMANYDYIVDSSALAIYLKDGSKGNIANWYWDFGDNNISTDQNPSHTYTEPGFYLVSLSVSDEKRNCFDYYSQMIKVGQVNCHASFNYTIGHDTVKFRNNSESTLANYYWDFGDGNSSVETEPNHEYKKIGIYQVSLTVTNITASCMDNIIIPVQVGTVSCNAQFSYSIDTINDSAYFRENILADGTNVLWSFGDGNASITHNPVHKYLFTGYYTVSLSTYNSSSPPCMDYYEKLIHVGNNTLDCEADFMYDVNPINLNVQFTDNSKGNITSYFWNFGDDNPDITNNTDPNPLHKYNNKGFFNVCHIVVDKSNISDLSCKKISIGTTDTSCEANFIFTIDYANKSATFYDKSIGTPNQWEWNFNDSSANASIQNPSHPYSRAGYYTVSLKITNSISKCSNKTYKLIGINQLNNGLKAGFGFDPQKGKKAGGYPVDFIGVGLGDQSRLRWTYGDSTNNSDTTTTTPTYTYTYPGNHTVCYAVSDPITGQGDTICKTVTTTGANEIPVITTTNGTELLVFPNPFRYSTTISYELNRNTMVELSILDFSGRKIITVIEALKNAGKYSIGWNGSGIEKGIYILQLKTKEGIIRTRIIVKQ